MAFVHILLPQKVFTQRIIEIFEEINEQENYYIFFGPKSDIKINDGFVNLWTNSQQKLLKFVMSKRNIEGIILHGIVTQIDKFIELLPSKFKIAWYFWGYEPFRANWRLETKTYFEETHKIIKKTSPFYWYRSFHPKYRFVKRPFAKIFDRIDYCVSYLKEDYEFLIKEKIISNKTIWMPGNVGFWEQVVDFNEDIPSLGNNILVGNSAHFANNHIEIFQILSAINLVDRKIIVPLSYGNKRYRKVVLRKGKEILGDNFCPLISFMPLDEYTEFINSCGTYFMNHQRQQALGNINLGLWKGAKIFLNNTTLYQNYKKKGFHVNLISGMNQYNSADSLKNNSAIETSENRELLKMYLGRERIIQQAKDLLYAMSK